MRFTDEHISEAKQLIINDVTDFGSCLVAGERFTTADWMEYIDADDYADMFGMLFVDADNAKEFAKELMLDCFDCVVREPQLFEFIKDGMGDL